MRDDAAADLGDVWELPPTLAARNELLARAGHHFVYSTLIPSHPASSELRRAHDAWAQRRVPLACVVAIGGSPTSFEARWGASITRPIAPGAAMWRADVLHAIGGYDVGFEAFPDGAALAEIDAQRRAIHAGTMIGRILVEDPRLPPAATPTRVPTAAEVRMLAKDVGALALVWAAARDGVGAIAELPALARQVRGARRR